MINNKKMVNNKIINNNKFNVIKQVILIFAIALFVFLAVTAVSAADLPSFDGNNSTTVRNETTVASTSVSDNKIIVTSLNGSQYDYEIKGVCYSRDQNSKQFYTYFKEDLKKLKAINANTIRTYRLYVAYDSNNQVNYTKTTEMLDAFATNGVSILVGIADDEIETSLLNTYLSHYANHPAILGFCIGNEYNYHYSEWFGPDEVTGKINWMTKLNNTATVIKAAAPNRLVTTAHGELPSNEDVILYNSMPNLDLVMVNVYSGNSFWDRFTNWDGNFSASAKPIVFSEFGRSSKSGSGVDTSQQQLEWTESLLNEIFAHLNTNSAGGFLFEAVDEIWKGTAEGNSVIGSEASLGLFTNGSGTPEAEAKPVTVKIAQLWGGNISKNVILSQVNTSNILSLSTLNPVINSPVTFSAVLNTSYGVLSGRIIKFYLNGNLIGQNLTNSSGVAIFKYTFTNTGNFQAFASFEGTDVYQNKNSSVLSGSVSKLVPNLSLSSNLNSASVNSVVIFSAVLDGGSGVVSGKVVDFYRNNVKVGSNITNSNGIAIYYLNFTNAGSFNVFASFIGDSSYNSSNSSVKSISITKVPTTISLSSSVNSVGVNSVVVFSAVLNGGSGVLSGKVVDFYINDVKVGSNVTNSNGLAIYYLNFTSVGGYDVFASFAGDSNCTSSNSSVKLVSISKIPTVISLKMSKSSVKYGYLVKFTANLTDNKNKTISGQKVYFYLGSKKLGFNTTNSQGIAIFNYYGKTVGKFNVIAKLVEDSNYYANSSNIKTLTLSKDTAKVTFAIAKSRLKIKEKVKISITLKSSLKKAIKSQKVYLYAVGKSWFTATINSLGKVDFYAKGYAKGTFTVYIKFKGNSYYKSANSNKIKVTLY